MREKKLSIIRFIVLFIDFLVYGHYGPFTKKPASYLPRFNFDGPFLDEKSNFQIANFQHFRFFAKIDDFLKISQDYNFKVEGCAFGF